jgi:putative ABC transport system ATP-binding protein
MSKENNETIIELKAVTKRYGFGDAESYALHNFDLTVKRGEFIMIMGPSGCGKTTLLNIIGLLDKPTSGEYLLNGKNVEKIPSRRKAHFRAKEIGFIFQNFNLIPNLSVIENVSLPLIYSGHHKTRRLRKADDILEHFHLREREYYMPYQLSGGQQQRVAIARSLISDPSIILADEPTGNLDSRSSHIIMEELRDIHAQGNTIIMVTHNPALTTYATRVINMLDGEIDTDIKTVADSDLPRPGDPEKISVRILSKKRPVELEVDSQTKVVVSGEHVTIGKGVSKKQITDIKKNSNDDKKADKSKKKEQKTRKIVKKTDKKSKDEKKES